MTKSTHIFNFQMLSKTTFRILCFDIQVKPMLALQKTPFKQENMLYRQCHTDTP